MSGGGRRAWADVQVEDAAALDDPSEEDLESWSGSASTPRAAGTQQRQKPRLKNRPMTRDELRRDPRSDDEQSSGEQSLGSFSGSGSSLGVPTESNEMSAYNLQNAEGGIEELTKRSGIGQYSVGSALHDAGCKPCLFVSTALGCQNGADCEYCHLQHSRGSKPRPGKGKRDRYKKLIARTCESASQAGSDSGSGSSTREVSERGYSSAGSGNAPTAKAQPKKGLLSL